MGVALGPRRPFIVNRFGLRLEGFSDCVLAFLYVALFQSDTRPFRLYSLKTVPEFMLLPLRAPSLRAKILNGPAFQYKGPAELLRPFLFHS